MDELILKMDRAHMIDTLGVSVFLGIGCTSMFCSRKQISLGHLHDNLMFDVYLYLTVQCFSTKSQIGRL